MEEQQHKVKVQPIRTASGATEIQAICSCGVLITQAGEFDSADLQGMIGKHGIDVIVDVVTKSLGEGAAILGAELKKLADKRNKAHPKKPKPPKDNPGKVQVKKG